MERDIAVKVENVSKIYKLYDNAIDRLKESINIFGRKYHREFYALRNVSFEIVKGETVGIIGKNGSGKSTLLKIITGVLTPSSGVVHTKGNISSLLELGAGFNPEYTGIENIYLNGTILGYTKEQIDEKLEGIVSFADIGNFIYQPVKTYSSGMFARLAFAVAINVDPDILIVDEALSVGDVYFQSKCFHKFERFKEMGKTILFVSHDLSSIKQLCSKVLWLDNGVQKGFGCKESICAQYINSQIQSHNKIWHGGIPDSNSKIESCNIEGVTGQAYAVPKIVSRVPAGGTGEGEILSFFIKNDLGEIVSTLQVEKDYSFHIIAKFFKEISNVLFGFFFENRKGIKVLGINNAIQGKVLKNVKTGYCYEAVFKVRLPKIQKGEYLISPSIAFGTQEDHIVLNWYHNLMRVTVENSGYNLSVMELDSEINIKQHQETLLSFYEANYD